VRDIIWTVIVLWVIWKIYDAFKSVSKPKTQTHGYNSQQNNNYHNQKKEGEVKIDPNAPKQKSHFKPEDGEYVDYEEVK
jgi:hypothetical protein